MNNALFDRTIAFAGICQPLKLMQEIAKTGTCDSEAFYTCLRAITITDPKSATDVFEREENLKIGLKVLATEIESSQSNQDLTRFLINLLALERKLSANKETVAKLGQRLETIQRQMQHYELADDQMVSNLASIYLDLISPLGPRIQVVGDPKQLQLTTTQNKVRALLLSAIRSAVLWRQVGGKKRHLIFSRKAMIDEAYSILARI